MILEHVNSWWHLFNLRHYEISRDSSKIREGFCWKHFFDHPITHILIVFGESNKDWLDEVSLDFNQGGKLLEFHLDLGNGSLLICNYVKNCGEISRANLWKNLKTSLLLFHRDEIGRLSLDDLRRLFKWIAHDRNVVDRESWHLDSSIDLQGIL